MSGEPADSAEATPGKAVVRAIPYTKESPYAMSADDTVPTRKNLSAASTAMSSPFWKPAST